MVKEGARGAFIRSAKVGLTLALSVGLFAAGLRAEWALQVRYPSPWDEVVLVVPAIVLTVGLVLIYRRTDARWWEIAGASLLCAVVALSAWIFLGLMYACAHGDCL